VGGIIDFQSFAYKWLFPPEVAFCVANGKGKMRAMCFLGGFFFWGGGVGFPKLLPSNGPC